MRSNHHENPEINTLFLRDGGVLLGNDENNFIKRLSRSIKLAQDNNIGIQITVCDNFMKGGSSFKDAVLAELKRIERVLIHLHARNSSTFGKNRFTKLMLSEIKSLFNGSDNIVGLCVHPDLVEDFSVLETFLIDHNYIGIETLDSTVKSGNRFVDIKKIVTEYPFLDVVLDMAHIQEMAGYGEPDLTFYLETFGSRVKEMHVSRFGNFYDPGAMQGDFSTTHSLLSLHEESSNYPISSAAENISLVIEGVIPCGRYGEILLEKETAIIKDLFC